MQLKKLTFDDADVPVSSFKELRVSTIKQKYVDKHVDKDNPAIVKCPISLIEISFDQSIQPGSSSPAKLNPSEIIEGIEVNNVLLDVNEISGSQSLEHPDAHCYNGGFQSDALTTTDSEHSEPGKNRLTDDEFLDLNKVYRVVQTRKSYSPDGFTWADFDDKTLYRDPKKKQEFDAYLYCEGFKVEITSPDTFSKILFAKEFGLLEIENLPDTLKERFESEQQSYASLCKALLLFADLKVVRYDSVLDDINNAEFYQCEDIHVAPEHTRARARTTSAAKYAQRLEERLDDLRRGRYSRAGEKKAELVSTLLLRRNDLGDNFLRRLLHNKFEILYEISEDEASDETGQQTWLKRWIEEHNGEDLYEQGTNLKHLIKICEKDDAVDVKVRLEEMIEDCERRDLGAYTGKRFVQKALLQKLLEKCEKEDAFGQKDRLIRLIEECVKDEGAQGSPRCPWFWDRFPTGSEPGSVNTIFSFSGVSFSSSSIL